MNRVLPSPIVPQKPYQGFGGAKALWGCRAPEVLLAGPSGTGKSRGCLEKLNFLALKYPGLRALIVRKTRESLLQSGLVTLERDVVVPGCARYYCGRAEWRYRNGSVLVAGGMDKVGKIMSAEYDVIYVQEATELNEDEWEHLTTRLRRAAMPYQQIIACANPAGPNHWLKRRAEGGRLVLLSSGHEDNPLLYDSETGEFTPFGSAYLAKLDALSGVRYQRLRRGLWVAAEGMVYDQFDWNLHLMDRFNPPQSWPRYWVVDFGYTHPFVWQAYAKDEAGRLYRFAELYLSGILVEEAAAKIKEWKRRTGEDFPDGLICDHDAEGRATLEKHLGIPTIAAKKSVSPGLQAVMKRLQVAEDGRPRLFFLRGSAIARDRRREEAKEPISTEEEFELYLWQDGVKDSVPVKHHDHGMDALRYLCMHADGTNAWSLEALEAWTKALRKGAPRPPDESYVGSDQWREQVAEINRQKVLRARGLR